MNKRLVQVTMFLTTLTAASAVAVAQQSEYQSKIQEDLDGYKDRIVGACKATPQLQLRWEGRLEGNPRDSERDGWHAISHLCTAGTDAIYNVCTDNKVAQRALSSMTAIVCTRGRGPLTHKYAGHTMTFYVDPSYTKNNISGQQTELTVRLKKELDR